MRKPPLISMPLSCSAMRMVKRFIAAVPALLVLFGCAAQQKVWVKPGLTQEQFAKDRYSCMQQSQQRVSAAFVNEYGGSSSNHVITNANLFSACMSAQGYTLQQKASLAEQAAQQAATKDQAKAAIESINSEMVEVCAREDLRPYYSKTSCKAEDTTLAQMADRSRITNDEKVAMNEARVEVKRINKEVEDAIRQYSPQVASSTIARREQASAEQDKNNEDFYEGSYHPW